MSIIYSECNEIHFESTSFQLAKSTTDTWEMTPRTQLNKKLEIHFKDKRSQVMKS